MTDVKRLKRIPHLSDVFTPDTFYAASNARCQRPHRSACNCHRERSGGEQMETSTTFQSRVGTWLFSREKIDFFKGVI